MRPQAEDTAPDSPRGAPVASLDDSGGATPSRAELQAHLTNCATCAHELALLQNITATLRDLPPQTAPANFRAAVLARIEADKLEADSAPVRTSQKVSAATPDVSATPNVPAASRPVRRARLAWPDFLRQPARVAWAGGAVFASLVLLLTLVSRGPQSFRSAPESALSEPFVADNENKGMFSPAPPAAGEATKTPIAKARVAKQSTGNSAKSAVGRSTAEAMSAAPRQSASAEAGTRSAQTNQRPPSPPTGATGDIRAQQKQRGAARPSSGKAINGEVASAEANAPRWPTERSERQAQQLQTRGRVSSPLTGAVRPTARTPVFRRRGLSIAEAARPARFARLEIAQMPLREADVRAANAGASSASAASASAANTRRMMGLPPSDSAFFGGAMADRAAGRSATSAGVSAGASSEVKATPERQSQRGEAPQGSVGGAPAAAPAPPRGVLGTGTRARGAEQAPRAAAPAPPSLYHSSPARAGGPPSSPSPSTVPSPSGGVAAPPAQRKRQSTRQDEALALSKPLDVLGLGAVRPGAVRRARLLVVPSSDADQTRIRVVLPPGLSFVDGADAARLGVGNIYRNQAANVEAQHTRIVWTGRARRGRPIEIVLLFAAPPGPVAVRVAQEAPVSRALPEQESESARRPVWKTINEQTVTVTIR